MHKSDMLTTGNTVFVCLVAEFTVFQTQNQFIILNCFFKNVLKEYTTQSSNKTSKSINMWENLSLYQMYLPLEV